MSCTLEPAIQTCDTGQQIPFFHSFQLTITWMSTIKLNTDCICLGHLGLVNNARSLQETFASLAANQNTRTFVAI